MVLDADVHLWDAHGLQSELCLGVLADVEEVEDALHPLLKLVQDVLIVLGVSQGSQPMDLPVVLRMVLPMVLPVGLLVVFGNQDSPILHHQAKSMQAANHGRLEETQVHWREIRTEVQFACLDPWEYSELEVEVMTDKMV